MSHMSQGLSQMTLGGDSRAEERQNDFACILTHTMRLASIAYGKQRLPDDLSGATA